MNVLVDILGWLGMILLLAAYTLLSLKKLRGDGWAYQLMNMIGGLALASNSAYHGAIPVAILNVSWFIIGIFGFVSARRKRATEEAAGSGA